MTDKFSVLIKYSYLDVVDNANLSDEDFGLLMKSVINYDRTGKEPKFKKQNLTMAFAFIKCDIDKNKKKWEERVIANQSNGKKGGRPPKNPNNPEEPKKPSGLLENPNNPEEPKKPDSGYVSGYDLDLDPEFDPDNKNLDSCSSYEQPQLIETIKKEAETNGFYLNTSSIKKIISAHPDVSCLTGQHTFIEFCAKRIRNIYPDKSNESLRPIFISALKDREKWEDFRDEYPQWRKKQEEKATEKAHEKAINIALSNPPQKCECGGRLERQFENYRCMAKNCNNIYTLDKSSLKWTLI